MPHILLINAAEPEETRVVRVEDGQVAEYRRERSAAGKLLGNIYQGRVVNMERGIGAAFLDIDVGRNAFLHVSNCSGVAPEDHARIEDRFALGDEALVQVTRESIGSKGPVLTGNVSLPGHFLVLLPFSPVGGVSRRIGEEDDRSKLRAVVKELEKECGMGLIVRTAGADRSKKELAEDLERLQRLWAAIQARAQSFRGPALLYAETDLVARALRDLADDEIAGIYVDTPEALARARETLEAIHPELEERLHLHAEATPLFHAFDVETRIDRLRARRVPLPGGGSLVFDRTEALVAVDVNSGRMREQEGLEETALQTNLEAAEEIARQLRLRDLGGVVAVDFIDMRRPDNVQAVERAFRESLGRDRARVRSGRLGPFGIYVLTRQRTGAGGVASRRPCPRCGGTGEVFNAEEVAVRVFRELRAHAARKGAGPLTARVSPEVAEILTRERSGELEALSEEAGRPVDVEADPALAPEQWSLVPPES